jgi:RHS repeat-associated protein
MIDASNGNKVYFYHFDRTGSTLALTDSSGTVTDSYAYTPYGAVIGHQGTTIQPFTYAGRFGVRQEGPSTGSGGTLYQMRARYYDAVTGRFLSREPLWPNLSDPRQLNPYAYALNNPADNVDVTGATPIGVGEGTTFTGSVFTQPVNTINGVQYPLGYNQPHPIVGLTGTSMYSTPPPPVPPRPPVASGTPVVQNFCSWTEAAAKAATFQALMGNPSGSAAPD